MKNVMGKEEREAILANDLIAKIRKANGEVCKFDCGTGVAILGRYVDGGSFFWIEGDEHSTYIVKGKRFFNVSGGEIRMPVDEGAPAIPVKKAAEKKEKSVVVVIPKGGEMVKQLGYDGKEEELNAIQYCNKIVCECGNVRWIKNSDVFQVKKCKPCMKKKRKEQIGKLKKYKKSNEPAAKKPVVEKSVDLPEVAPSRLAAKKESAKREMVKRKRGSR